VILGGTGYVSGELLRILSGHPVIRPRAVVSTSRAGEPVAAAFPHLAGTGIEALCFQPVETVRFRRHEPAAIFAATPHGETAAVLDALLARAESSEAPVHAVDLSADFRFADPAGFEAVYGTPHGAPRRMGDFVCAVPEHAPAIPARHAAQPGCFTTAAVLAAYPFFALDLVEGPAFVSAVTGSSGSGRTPGPGTHHPERRSALYAYAPLAHRHEAEMRALLGAARGGDEPEVEFVPHSGPFVRGIHATVRLGLKAPAETGDLAAAVAAFYAACPFVRVEARPPHLNEVVGTNLCRLGVTARGRTVVVTSVIDNLVKGAAGGAVQWMNRLLDLPETAGLQLPGLGVF
jgi:N-acetyl-gamma-glutamyl-phosphate reductase